VAKKKTLGRPVQYPEKHPYNDPRKRVADAVGMLEAMKLPYGPRNFEQEVEERVRDFVAFMWAVEGRELSSAEIATYRLELLTARERAGDVAKGVSR